MATFRDLRGDRFTWSRNSNIATVNESAYFSTFLRAGTKKRTIWCSLWSPGTIGPNFFEKEAVTVNSEPHDCMITDFFFGLQLKITTWTICGFDGSEYGHETSRIGGVDWPLRSCEATRKIVYADKPLALGHLKMNIRRVMAEMPPNNCLEVVKSYHKRIGVCKNVQGDHLNFVALHI